MTRRIACLAALLAATCLPAAAPAGSKADLTFVTLGTQGGPMPSATRSQPANLLLHDGEATLIDAGDGAAERLAAAGVPPFALKRVFISHLHFDHIGGLAAILGLRYATNSPGKLAIFGPPGTREMVAGLIASMGPTSRAGYGVPGETSIAPADTVSVVEMVDGSRQRFGDMEVRAVANTHYSFAPGSPQAQHFQSLAFRFDVPGRSVVYTGDTGPSAAVEKLATRTDLLVAEMIDLPGTIAAIRAQGPAMPQHSLDLIVRHLSDHHLTPEAVGTMAARSGAHRLVVTHLAGPSDDRSVERNRRIVEGIFHGPVAIARDLDRFEVPAGEGGAERR